MSIPNIFNKIKSKIDIDKETFMYLCIIILVGLSSFGLGRLSVLSQNKLYNEESRSVTEIPKIVPSDTIEQIILLNDSQKDQSNNMEIEQEKKYVASKNGKLYYTKGCKAANRIKPENEIWFSSAEEAKRAGLSASTSCK